MRKFLRQLIPRKCLRWTRHCLARLRCRAFASPTAVNRALRKSYPEWAARIADVCASPDNEHIPRVPEAGRVANGLIVMHNGLQVGGLSYTGGGALQMLVANRGVHEPQEERAFGEVLPYVKPGSSMLELGAFWSFYSLWFMQRVPNAKSFIVEPDATALAAGRLNRLLNKCDSIVEQAYVGDPTSRSDDGTPFITVDQFCERHSISQLAILHADIQYAELAMLQGAKGMLEAHRVDYVFISSHSNELHYSCIDSLRRYGYLVLASADLNETYSYDGLIVARAPEANGPDSLTISHKGRT